MGNSFLDRFGALMGSVFAAGNWLKEKSVKWYMVFSVLFAVFGYIFQLKSGTDATAKWLMLFFYGSFFYLAGKDLALLYIKAVCGIFSLIYGLFVPSVLGDSAPFKSPFKFLPLTGLTILGAAVLFIGAWSYSLLDETVYLFNVHPWSIIAEVPFVLAFGLAIVFYVYGTVLYALSMTWMKALEWLVLAILFVLLSADIVMHVANGASFFNKISHVNVKNFQVAGVAMYAVLASALPIALTVFFLFVPGIRKLRDIINLDLGSIYPVSWLK